GVEAHHQHGELLPRREGERLQARGEPAEALPAQHRAPEVDEREQHGLPVEVVAERNRSPALVAEGEVERERGAEVLLDAHVTQGERPRLVRREWRGEREYEDGERDGPHFAASLATSSIARVIGMWTTPAARSSQP